ncbi:MAG TPA: hypothetical protein VHX86_10670 [Tepidisphaeraceae bacterium]|jgi:hypothetical protein|nr:hypothetical protein [Tepidisphaeraceae bacterium]
MARKIGEEFVKEMLDRGRRELGGVLYHDSNVAQPMYPLRGGYEVSKEAESPEVKDRSLEDGRQPSSIGRDEPGRDDPEIERE